MHILHVYIRIGVQLDTMRNRSEITSNESARERRTEFFYKYISIPTLSDGTCATMLCLLFSTTTQIYTLLLHNYMWNIFLFSLPIHQLAHVCECECISKFKVCCVIIGKHNIVSQIIFLRRNSKLIKKYSRSLVSIYCQAYMCVLSAHNG